MGRVVPLLLSLTAAFAVAAPALAYWSVGGMGSGSGATATLGSGNTPTTSVAARSITVSFVQTAFAGGTVGTRGGSYTLQRYQVGDTSTVYAPGTGCSGTITGTASSLSCTEANVPYGDWVYRVTPTVNTFTGTQSASSATATVTLPAPVLTGVTAQNPAAGSANGPIAVSWSASTDASGYNVYRRVAGGSFNFAAPLNGATPLTATSYSDATGTNNLTYDYVVRAIGGPPAGTVSADSNVRSDTVITRPSSPPGAVTTSDGGGGAININWNAVAGAEVVGYNVYRRTTTGSFDYNAPLNGATPDPASPYRDVTSVIGSSYVYVVRTVRLGAGGVQVESVDSNPSASATCSSNYATQISATAGLSDYFRLGETSGTAAANAKTAARAGLYGGGFTLNQSDAIVCDNNPAVLFNGSTGYLGAPTGTAGVTGTNTFSVEVWFNTTTTRGGKLVGFGNARTGSSSSYDRHIYMANTGQLYFGVYPNAVKTVASTASYNDGAWHHAVGTLGTNGLRLIVDGVEVAADPAVTSAQAYTGYWRAGYDNLTGWTNPPTSNFFAGTLDEFAVYSTQLTTPQAAAHYAAGRP